MKDGEHLRMTVVCAARVHDQRREGEAYGSFCTPNNMRVKKDGKLSNAATEFSH